MDNTFENLTGRLTEAYTLHAGCEPHQNKMWVYENEEAFLDDVSMLMQKLGKNFHKTSSWKIRNSQALGMTITFSNSISLPEYIKKRRKHLRGGEGESEEE